MSDSSGAPVTARAIVAGHGSFAAGLVSAVDQITGNGAMFIPVAVQGLCTADIEALLRVKMREAGVHVIFTDLQAGSCTMAARRILRGMHGAVLIAGCNLPTLIDFVFADGIAPADAARHAAERGRGAITVLEATA
jgi:PTS system N-acetylgalactosamine-specific IIA component